MVVIKDGKKYYTIEESIEITDKYIEKSADNLILELRKKRAKKSYSTVPLKEEIYA